MVGFPVDPADQPSAPSLTPGLPKRFRRNVFTGYLRTGSSAVISLVMTPVLINGLGTEAFGIWIVVGSLVWYREILEFGFAAALPKYVAEYSTLGDRERLRTSIATSFWLLAGLGVFVLGLGFGLATVFADLFGVSPDLVADAELLVVIIAIDFALAMPGDAFSGVLVGLQRYDLMNVTFVVVSIAQAIAIAVVLAAGGGLVALGIATVAISLAGQVWRCLLAARLLPELSLSPRRIDRHFIRPFAGLSMWIGIGNVATLILSRIDTMIVAAVLGIEAAAVYAVGQKLTLVIGQLSTPVAAVFYPHSSELAAQREHAGLRQSLVTGTRIQLAVAIPLALAMALLAGMVIEAWVGAGFEDAAPVVVFLAGAVSIWGVSETGSAILGGMGRARGPGLIRVAEALLNVGLSIALAHAIGLEGVAVATLIAAVAANLLVLFPYVCRQLGVRLRDFAGPLLVAHAPPAAAATAVGLLLAQADPTSIPAVLAAALAIVATYLGVFTITGVDRHERRALMSPLRGLRSRLYGREA